MSPEKVGPTYRVFLNQNIGILSDLTYHADAKVGEFILEVPTL